MSAFLTSMFGPAIAGFILALLVSVGLVYSQTSAPSSNPADKPILSYGTN